MRRPATTTQRLFDLAIHQVHESNGQRIFISEREWFSGIESHYHALATSQGLTVTHVVSPSSITGIWTLTHSSEFGGYIGCLTFAHLVPYPIHSPICPLVMVNNFECRISGEPIEISKCDKIPIDGIVYRILGLPELAHLLLSNKHRSGS